MNILIIDCVDLSQESKSTQKTFFTPQALTVGSVFKKLKELALMTGNSVSSH